MAQTWTGTIKFRKAKRNGSLEFGIEDDDTHIQNGFCLHNDNQLISLLTTRGATIPAELITTHQLDTFSAIVWNNSRITVTTDANGRITNIQPAQ